LLPASTPRAIAKARTLDVDMVVLDLEDAVREEDKSAAREQAIGAIEQGFGARTVAIRINHADSPHFGHDVACVRRCAGLDHVVLAKAETARQVHDTYSLVEHPVVAMIESACGVIAAPSIASSAAALIAGTNDLRLALGVPPGTREGLVVALQQIVLAARAAGIAAFDGVYNGLQADEALAAECRQGRLFGFDGKSVIHPNQVETVNHAFSPTPEEIERARSLVAAAQGGAQRHQGEMIEDLHVAQARILLARAGT
jgi:citrate lyase subunit beta/citryl-CoA lyase